MNALRMTQLTVSVIILIGIWLTGFDTAHWLLYVPAVMLAVAAISGICPGMKLWGKLGFK